MQAVDIVGSELKFDEIVPFLVEVELSEHIFLRVKETLMRIGIPGKNAHHENKPTLIQTCHILTKRGKYYICHFKTLFILDGKDNNLTVADIARQNKVIKLLQDWGLVKIVKPEMIDNHICSLKTVKVVKYQDRENWNLVSKYDVGACIRKGIE
jgi:hypothetical protein